jgi:hypothetical protein
MHGAKKISRDCDSPAAPPTAGCRVQNKKATGSVAFSIREHAR